ncbi:enoyl-CoA hydratase/isomerase family protein [Roseomonas sp. SSH11]|uniref:Enoyl-CoA hydratase/isomerase family protein n=1 Tax=Pararoseomonas baculiformis TaxID=2820812 RepID=A0ABS4ADG1_9PROT|nr:enoyl-CoA hydratase-related protein [Pararoseomonas baculiformis]MBP0445049.1 enoyl-CoA hydratase/isomerase family protein [Pararoseomonas baculiformis]
MEDSSVTLEVDARGIATLTLNRPEIGNAYDGNLLRRFVFLLDSLASHPGLRAVIIRGAGRHFQCGADLGWMAEIAQQPPELAREASRASVTAFRRLNEFPLPTMALVQGACFGGGCGLLCCVDVALAVPGAVFGLTEVRVGVAPTPISTQLVQTLGLHKARRYALTGERFDAATALAIGLVHEVVPADDIEARLEALVAAFLAAAPQASAVTKHSLLRANRLLLTDEEADTLAEESWRQRASDEGKEGLRAFREKRRPLWQP